MKGLLIFVLILALIGYLAHYLFNKYSKSPNQQTQTAAQNISRFPYAINWQIENNKNICINTVGTCQLSTNIIFESQKEWRDVYSFYIEQMLSAGWKTNTQIYTSLPTSIVFTNDNGCQADLSPKNKQFIFSVVCP